ncbi:hypothetical protein Sjap_000547 [Stephania japonica]|uniref:Uncharacterized protein n=1 Tax=Stephania japonica TaxID=461633 RepID=A0AAP0PQU7_9MAGN
MVQRPLVQGFWIGLICNLAANHYRSFQKVCTTHLSVIHFSCQFLSKEQKENKVNSVK